MSYVYRKLLLLCRGMILILILLKPIQPQRIHPRHIPTTANHIFHRAMEAPKTKGPIISIQKISLLWRAQSLV